MGKAAAQGPFFHQVHFSELLAKAKVDIVDWCGGKYLSPFFSDNPDVPNLREFSASSKEYLIVPVQMLFRPELRREALVKFSF